MSPSRRPGNARANFAWVMRDVFNTKGHKELLSGMYRSTKIFGVGSAPRVRNGGANIAGVMAVGRDVPIAPHRPVAVGNARG